ncbi:DUF6009 family protein, partial [Streptomyces globisporus]
EAVDPATLTPRTKGQKTERSEGGPLSTTPHPATPVPG